jgi:hypothetical protein
MTAWSRGKSAGSLAIIAGSEKPVTGAFVWTRLFAEMGRLIRESFAGSRERSVPKEKSAKVVRVLGGTTAETDDSIPARSARTIREGSVPRERSVKAAFACDAYSTI